MTTTALFFKLCIQCMIMPDFYSPADRAAYNKAYKEAHREELNKKNRERYASDIEYYRKRNRIHNEKYRRRQKELAKSNDRKNFSSSRYGM